jgi:acetyl esterase/lipase
MKTLKTKLRLKNIISNSITVLFATLFVWWGMHFAGPIPPSAKADTFPATFTPTPTATPTPTYTTEIYATDVDAAGTDLRWRRFVPSTGGPTWPVVILAHGGQFKSQDLMPGNVTQHLTDAGYLVLIIEFRLAPPHTVMNDPNPPGDGQQDPPSDGRPPQQTDDVQRAIRAARADSQSDRRVALIGFSSGAPIGAWWAMQGAQGDDKLDSFIGCSGPYDLDSADILAIAFERRAIENYINHTIGEGVPFHDAAKAASPYWVTATSTPCPALLFNSTNEEIPTSEMTSMATYYGNAGGMIESHLRFGTEHGSDYWGLSYGGSFPTVKDCVIDFLNRTIGAFQLGAEQKRVRGINTVRLNWNGATSPNIDIYRNNVLIATQPNDPGVYIDFTGDTGNAEYTYRVCEAGTQTCSNEVLVRFPQ